MIRLCDAVNFLQANGYMVKNVSGLYDVIEIKTKKHKFSQLDVHEIIRLVETMMLGI